MTPQTFARSLSENSAAEDAACQADASEGPTFVGLVILATEGCQRLKAAATLTYRTEGSRDVVAFSWKGWWLMSVTTLRFLQTIILPTCTQLGFYKLTCSQNGDEVFSNFVLTHEDRQVVRVLLVWNLSPDVVLQHDRAWHPAVITQWFVHLPGQDGSC